MKTIFNLGRQFSKKAAKKAAKKARERPATASMTDLRESEYLNFNVTNDMYRIDLAVLIERPAIFLPSSDAEIYKMNLDSEFFFNNGLRFEFDKSLMDFSPASPLDSLTVKDRSDEPTHSKTMEDGKKVDFFQFSKNYKHVVLDEDDPQSIQYAPFNSVYLLVKHAETEDWCLPYWVMESRESSEIAINRLKIRTLGGDLVLKDKENYPVGTMVHQIEKSNLEKNPLLEKLKGRKAFVFTTFHNGGFVSLKNEEMYGEWRWVTKAKMNEFLSEENYDRISHLLTRY